MSILPSQHSDKIKLQIWEKLLELADILSAQFSVQSLVASLSQFFEQRFDSPCKIWLDPSIFRNNSDYALQEPSVRIDSLSSLMELAVKERKVVSSESVNVTNSLKDADYLAIPLLVSDQLLGVVQVETKAINLETEPNLLPCLVITSQYAIALGYVISITRDQYLKLHTDFSKKTAEIGASILTNLDLASMHNSLITLLHQDFGYPEVNVFIARKRSNSLKRFGMVDNEVISGGGTVNFSETHPVSWSLENRLPLFINDPDFVISHSSLHINPGNLAECVIPLFDGEKFIGALDLCSELPDVFGPETISGLYSLSQDLETAIRNANIFHIEYIRRQINEHIHGTVGLVSAQQSVNDVLNRLITDLELYLHYDAAAVWLLDDEMDEPDFTEINPTLRLGPFKISEKFKQESDQDGVFSDTKNLVESYYERTFGEEELLSLYPWLAKLISSSYPLIIDPIDISEPLGTMLAFVDGYSAIGGLLSVSNQPLGVIIAVAKSPNRYDLESQDILDAYIHSASIALRNSKLYSAAHDQAWIATVLLQVAEATQSITDMDELLETVASMLPELLNVAACQIFLWDSSIDAFLASASSGFDADQSVRLSEFDVFRGAVPAFDELIEDPRPVILNEDTLSPQIASQVFPGYDYTANLLVLFPLISQNSLCGAVLIDFTNSDLEIHSSQKVWDEKYTLIEGVARQAASAIENLQLIKIQEEEAYISIALLQVAQAIVSLNNLDEILASIVRITPILVGVKRCIIYLWNYNELVFRQSEYYGFTRSESVSLGEINKGEDFPFLQAIQQEMKILYYPQQNETSPGSWCQIMQGEYFAVETTTSDTSSEPKIRLDSISQVRSERLLIGFPLSVKGEFLGTMLIEEEDVVKGSPSLHIRARRIEIVQGITQQAAIAIKNELLQQEAVKNERLERELQLAREIQAAFMPERLPELVGWDIAARWQPARQVGGDFYDVLVLDDNHVGLVIADVADKGMPAALFMTLIRSLLRAAAREQRSPAVVLKQVNDLLVPDSKNSMFVTIFYAVVSLDTGQFLYANAGHNPPVIKRVDSPDLVELTLTSMPLGIFGDLSVDERQASLNPGDWLLLYTDGITEAFSASEEIFGQSRLYSIVKMAGYSSAKDLINQIESAIGEFIKGTEISDDITMVVVNRK